MDCDDRLICSYNLADNIHYAHGELQVRESGGSVPVGQLVVVVMSGLKLINKSTCVSIIGKR